MGAARCRRGPCVGLGPLFVGLLGWAASVARACGSGAGGGLWGRRAGGSAAAGALSGGARGARLPGRVRQLERDLGAVVDRGRALLGVPEPRSRVCRLRANRARARAVRAALVVRARRRARAPPRLGSPREGGARPWRLGTDRAAELADRVLERARAAVCDGPIPGAVAGGAAGAPALAPDGRRRLRVRARRRAVADLLARGRAGGRRGG